MASKCGSAATGKSVPKFLAALSLGVALSGFSGIVRADDMEEAMRFYDGGYYVHAVDRFRAAAIAGNAQAQEILAFMYAMGSDVYPGVPHDVHAAAHWFDIAARNGRPVSRYVACAMRHEVMGAKVPHPHCFDWVAEVGKPGPR
jgi:TPR repeat protein